MISAVGVGCAGAIDASSHIVKISPNIPALKGYSFGAVLRKLTRAPVRVYNDVNAALYGELKCGAATRYKHVIGVFIGTGVGAAIAIDGKLYVGGSGHAGDIGYFLVHPLRLITGSRLGMLDNIVSRTAIAAEAAALAARHAAPHLLKMAGTDVRNIKSGELARAIRAGDKSVEELVKSRAQVLGIALSSLVNFLNPQMIVLGGGFTNAMPTIVREQVTAGVKTHATPGALRGLRIVTSKLKGHAVTIGAAKLALDDM
jgi:glucokinase